MGHNHPASLEVAEEIVRYVLPREIILPNEAEDKVKVTKPDGEVYIYTRMCFRGRPSPFFVVTQTIDAKYTATGKGIKEVTYPSIFVYGVQYSFIKSTARLETGLQDRNFHVTNAHRRGQNQWSQ